MSESEHVPRHRDDGVGPAQPAQGRRVRVLTPPHGAPLVATGNELTGHAPGAVCLYVHDLGCVFTGDTLFEGGPGATGRSYSDADLIKKSIRARLLELPGDTVVHTGHGPDTTIGAEREAMAPRAVWPRPARLPGDEAVP